MCPRSSTQLKKAKPTQRRMDLKSLFVLLLAAFVFLFPIKYGTITGVPELPYLPTDFATWIFFTFCSAMFPVGAGALLLIALLLFRRPSAFDVKGVIAAAFLALAFVSMIGAVRASVFDFAILHVCHFFGLAAFSLCAWCVLEDRPEAGRMLLYAVFLSALIAVVMGFHQMLWGFQQNLDYIYERELETGMKITGNLRGRMEQTRIFSTFSLCNSFAAHLVLTMPACIVMIVRELKAVKTAIIVLATAMVFFVFPSCSQTAFFFVAFAYSTCVVIVLFKFPEAHARYYSWGAAILVGLGFICMLKGTSSRAAVAAFGLSLVIMALAVAAVKFRGAGLAKIMAGLLVLCICMASLYVLTSRGRDGGLGLPSLSVRLDYDRVALKIFLAEPLLGTGWGDFFHMYPTMKSFPGTEAPHTPHNFVLAFACECGILGLIVSSLVLLLPVILVFREMFRYRNLDAMNLAIITGWIAWGIHSLFDINIDIPGTAGTAVLMLMFLKFNGRLPALLEKLDVARYPGAYKAAWYAAALVVLVICLGVSGWRLKGEYAFNELHSLCEPYLGKDEKSMDESVRVEQIKFWLARTTALMPYSPFPWATVGAYAERKGVWPLGEVCYAKALERSPERSSYYYRLGLCQARLGKMDDALRNVEKAARLFPNAEYSGILEKMRKAPPRE